MANKSSSSSNREREERRREILDYVLSNGQATAAELAIVVGKSLMTVHRALDDLAARGLVRKFHGGVSALPTSMFESSSEFRKQRHIEEKTALAAKALQLIEPGMSILLDDSTTVLSLAKLLDTAGPLTVLTNYREAIDVLVEFPEIRVIVIGGTYSKTHNSFIAAPHLNGLDSYAVDIAFHSTSTMDSRMTYHQEEGLVLMKRAMLNAGARRVLLMDSSKLGRTSLHQFVPLASFTDVILNPDAPRSVTSALSESVTLHLA
jgi:DeoR/GlpR family transcriptional regulator of sugar metabolism